MDLDLANRSIVVTGASEGIGRATALALAAEGARLALGARTSDRLERVAQECRDLGATVVTHVGDLVDEREVRRLVEAASREHGDVWGLVTCVGSTPIGTFEAIDDDTWRQAFEMKFLASARAVRAVLPAMAASGGGRIVLVGGNTAQDPTPWMVTSGAVNAALGNLAGTLARTYGPQGVGVVACHPGPVHTARYEGLRQAVGDAHGLDPQLADAWISEQIPRGRAATAQEVGEVITMLVSPRSAHVSGTTVTVDAGQTWPR